MTTRRTGAIGSLLLLAGLALGLVLAGPVGASEPGPAYPPGAGADDVVQPGGGAGAGGTGGAGGTAPAGATDDGGTAGHDPAAVSDGTGGAAADDQADAEVGAAATAENDDPDDPDDPDSEESAAGEDVSERAAPAEGGRGAGPILIVVGTAVLLGGAVVAIARRI